tara:strand:- start:972 stop:1109 length:138 start_codon:yes stop_codon:yes gene_type:complete
VYSTLNVEVTPVEMIIVEGISMVEDGLGVWEDDELARSREISTHE